MKKCILLILIIGCLTGCIDKIDPTSVMFEPLNTDEKPEDDMVLIPSGNFWSGYDGNWNLEYTNAYMIDRHEVSRGEYRVFCNAIGIEFPISSKYSDSHPITGISFENAQLYALWVGKRLPTDIEWEKAARGGLIKKPYVWGDTPLINGGWLAAGNFHLANKSEKWNLHHSEKSRDGRAVKINVRQLSSIPISSRRVNNYGIHDMGGNVSEYVMEGYDTDNQALDYVRGASYNSIYGFISINGKIKFKDSLLIKYRPYKEKRHIGFRCVRDLK